MTQQGQQDEAFVEAFRIFHEHHGILRTQTATDAGIKPRTLYLMRDLGLLNQIGRGLFRLTHIQMSAHTDFAIATARVPKGVVCLVSALAYHQLTTQIPRYVDMAYLRTWKKPHVDYPPIKIHRFSEESFREGWQMEIIDGIEVKIYCPEKTIADCFKFRRSLSTEICVEALTLYFRNRKADVEKIKRYARVCRVENVMKPYLDVVLYE